MKSVEWHALWLAHLFQNAALSSVGAGGGVPASASDGSLYLSLHTEDPGSSTASGLANEVSYTGYARADMPRDASTWDVTDNVVTNLTAVLWPACTAGGVTARYVGIWDSASTGAGVMLYSCALSQFLSIAGGLTPRIAAGGLVITEAV